MSKKEVDDKEIGGKKSEIPLDLSFDMDNLEGIGNGKKGVEFNSSILNNKNTNRNKEHGKDTGRGG